MPLTKSTYPATEPHIPGLTRFEYARSAGWLVRYYAIGQVHQRLFSDSRYGYDPAHSRTAACRWLLALSQQEPLRPSFRTRLSRRNRTGSVGICRRLKLERSGVGVLVYDVSYQRQGRRATKTFRVHRYHAQHAALSAAITFRGICEQAMNAERLRNAQQIWEKQSTHGLQERSGNAAD